LHRLEQIIPTSGHRARGAEALGAALRTIHVKHLKIGRRKEMDEKLVTLIPMEEIESGAQAQIKEALANPLVKKLAIMPDVHQGYSIPIGAVALVDGHVNPEYVGYDISCGMLWCRTGLRMSDLKGDRDDILKRILNAVPCGEGRRRDRPATGALNQAPFESASGDKRLDDEINKNVLHQLGTLGGGK
jgi:tRNA-splicing ligase RtcB